MVTEFSTNHMEEMLMNIETTVYTINDLLKILPFGRTKLLRLCRQGIIPVSKSGRQYFIYKEVLEKWLEDSQGHTI